ncbi:hypothetical protein K504DRAFT_523200 [Pleomassaria siparia CBS 279.74]|uniref:Uncharacterized protein n=1 Tax=Pleomassaria siparia CBS 279.74 TaxID=1314801 RepID=A0A6G1KH91_9PLEO|nr:hypothetical protein K504DRAFT_523200 [Pleomassaria siparia CBS 279.74]
MCVYMLCMLNVQGVHTRISIFLNPSTWDQLERWIASQSPSTLDPETFPASTPRLRPPWSSDPRICPDMKFTQVEFAAMLATVLREAKLEPCLGKRKTAGKKEARREREREYDEIQA